MAQLFTNNFKSTLASDISAAQTTIALSDASLLNTIPSNNFELLTLYQASLYEVVKITSRSGNTLIVERGFEGTAQSFQASKATVYAAVTKSTLDKFELASKTATDSLVSIGNNTNTANQAILDAAAAQASADQALSGGSGLYPAVLENFVYLPNTKPTTYDVADSYKFGEGHKFHIARANNTIDTHLVIFRPDIKYKADYLMIEIRHTAGVPLPKIYTSSSSSPIDLATLQGGPIVDGATGILEAIYIPESADSATTNTGITYLRWREEFVPINVTPETTESNLFNFINANPYFDQGNDNWYTHNSRTIVNGINDLNFGSTNVLSQAGKDVFQLRSLEKIPIRSQNFEVRAVLAVKSTDSNGLAATAEFSVGYLCYDIEDNIIEPKHVAESAPFLEFYNYETIFSNQNSIKLGNATIATVAGLSVGDQLAVFRPSDFKYTSTSGKEYKPKGYTREVVNIVSIDAGANEVDISPSWGSYPQLNQFTGRLVRRLKNMGSKTLSPKAVWVLYEEVVPVDGEWHEYTTPWQDGMDSTNLSVREATEKIEILARLCRDPKDSGSTLLSTSQANSITTLVSVVGIEVRFK